MRLLKGVYTHEEGQLFTWADRGEHKTRWNDFKLKDGRFRLNVWRKFFTEGAVRC